MKYRILLIVLSIYLCVSLASCKDLNNENSNENENAIATESFLTEANEWLDKNEIKAIDYGGAYYNSQKELTINIVQEVYDERKYEWENQEIKVQPVKYSLIDLNKTSKELYSFKKMFEFESDNTDIEKVNVDFQKAEINISENVVEVFIKEYDSDAVQQIYTLCDPATIKVIVDSDLDIPQPN